MEISRAGRRLVVMLGLSILLHAWLMEHHYGKGAARGSASGASIAARILPAASDPGISAPVTEASGVIEPEARVSQVFRAADSAAVPTPSMQAPGAASRLSATATAIATALSQPSDPTYYAVGDLDVFPKALVKPDLSAALAVNQEPTAGKVSATLLIDEAGVVNAVRGVEAPAGDIEIAARELLLRTRFTPARSKEGRIVKAQVLVALEYDTQAAPGLR